jgi:hypothetical protein
MKYCLYYWIIAPIRGDVRDNPERTAALSISINAAGEPYELSLYCDAENRPEFVRCRIPNLQTDHLPDKVAPLLQSFREHMLSTLRVTYRSELTFFQFPVWSFFDEGAPHSLNFSVEAVDNVAFTAEHTIPRKFRM